MRAACQAMAHHIANNEETSSPGAELGRTDHNPILSTCLSLRFCPALHCLRSIFKMLQSQVRLRRILVVLGHTGPI